MFVLSWIDSWVDYCGVQACLSWIHAPSGSIITLAVLRVNKDLAFLGCLHGKPQGAERCSNSDCASISVLIRSPSAYLGDPGFPRNLLISVATTIPFL